LEYRLASIKVFSKKMDLRAISQDNSIDMSPFKNPGADVLRKSYEKGTDNHIIQSSQHGELVSGIVPIFSRTETKAVVGLIVMERFIPGAFANQLRVISRGFEEYKQLKMLKRPIKISHIIWLSLVTLIIIFSSVWFGFFLSKGITVPIQKLAEGTDRIASGDYDFFIDLEAKDEIGDLVNSFNKMTLDLKNSKKQLEQANEELLRSNIEIEQRRLYMEIILANVAAGVVSADANGKILTINKSAEKMLNIKAEGIIGKNYKDIIGKEHVDVINEVWRDKGLHRKGFMERQIRLALGGKMLTLLVSLNMLRDDRGKHLGLVAVFEDLSEIERAQRMAAWREVARRIAHEVKNPLTPIKLSAQRLKKRYGDNMDKDDSKIFEDCTNMIINQVDELKGLVNEFSSFARMPTSNPVPDDLNQIIKESVSLYKEAQNVTITFNDSKELPQLPVDRDQMKRVLINLLDNAIDATDGKGEVVLDINYTKEEEIVKIEVADNGKGIQPDHKMRLFEPYFSTKKHGTGLGLTIVNTIINDHKGLIRVEDNEPRGTRFIIELPVKVYG
jgi:two-component system nitrogen regulation sensor histidine kinase NtrY